MPWYHSDVQHWYSRNIRSKRRHHRTCTAEHVINIGHIKLNECCVAMLGIQACSISQLHTRDIRSSWCALTPLRVSKLYSARNSRDSRGRPRNFSWGGVVVGRKNTCIIIHMYVYIITMHRVYVALPSNFRAPPCTRKRTSLHLDLDPDVTRQSKHAPSSVE